MFNHKATQLFVRDQWGRLRLITSHSFGFYWSSPFV